MESFEPDEHHLGAPSYFSVVICRFAPVVIEDAHV